MANSELNYTIKCLASPDYDYLNIREIQGEPNWFPQGRVIIEIHQPHNVREGHDDPYVVFNEEKVDELITALLFWKETHVRHEV